MVFGLIIAVASALKVFVFLPPRVDALEQSQTSQGAKIEALQAKTSATDVAIAGIVPQLQSINQGVSDIKSDIREIRADRR